MGGNQIQVIDTSIKSQPDLTILKGMVRPVVVVYKLLVDSVGGRKPGKDQLVVNHATGLTINEIIALQDDLPDVRKHPKGGPGTYRFEVTDQESAAKEVWQIRLGVGGNETGAVDPNLIDRPGGVNPVPTPLARPATAPTTASRVPAVPSTPVPVSPESEDIGNGFIYNGKYRTLTVPDGRIFNWNPGEALPKLTVQQPVAEPQQQSAPSTPLGSPLVSAPSPEMIEMRARNEALANELAAMREAAQERARREEIAALRTSHEKQIADLAAQFKTEIGGLVERLSAKPTEDPRVVELERRLADRERDAARDRELAALRSDFTGQITTLANAIRESQANRGPDPMMMGLLDYLKTQLANAQSSVLTPEKMLSLQRDLAERIKDTSASPLNEKIVSLMGGLLDMTLRFREANANLEGRGSGGIDWSSILQTVVERGGTAVAQISQAIARKAGAETARANAVAVTAQRDMRALEARQKAAPAAPAAPVKPAPPPTGEAARDALAASMFPPAPPAAAEPTPAEAAPAASTPAPSNASATRKRARRASAKEIEAFQTVPIEVLRERFAGKSDEEFFGPFLEAVHELRKSLEGDEESEPITPDEAAQYVLDAREFLKEAIEQNDGKPPLVTDFLVYGRFDYLFERLVPEAGQQFWIEAAEALQVKRAAEKAAQTAG